MKFIQEVSQSRTHIKSRLLLWKLGCFLCLCISTTSSFAQPPSVVSCEDVIERTQVAPGLDAFLRNPDQVVDLLASKQLAPVRALLDSFDLREIETVEGLDELSPAGVYKVLLKRGAKREGDIYGVLRVVSRKKDVEYEDWVAKLGLTVPGIVVSPIRVIEPTPAFRRLLVSRISQSTRPRHAAAEIKDNPDAAFKITLGVFFSGQTGFDYLDSSFNLMARLELLQIIVDLADSSYFSKYSLVTKMKFISDKIEGMQSHFTKQGIALLKEDAADLFEIKSRETISDHQFLVRLVFVAATHSPDRFASLVQENLFSQLPNWARSQLADLWAFTYLVAIADFFPFNWLIQESTASTTGHVLGIDLNYQSEVGFCKGSLDFECHSFTGGPGMPIAYKQYVIQHLSPSMIKWLHSVAEYEFPVSGGITLLQEQGVRDRALWILDQMR